MATTTATVAITDNRPQSLFICQLPCSLWISVSVYYDVNVPISPTARSISISRRLLVSAGSFSFSVSLSARSAVLVGFTNVHDTTTRLDSTLFRFPGFLEFTTHDYSGSHLTTPAPLRHPLHHKCTMKRDSVDRCSPFLGVGSLSTYTHTHTHT